MRIRWAAGITTVPSRLIDLFPRTLQSLRAGGFDISRIFVDGAAKSDTRWEKFDLETTLRTPQIRPYGNFILGLAELYIRSPTADRYAMFQDDLVCVRNLRQYLEAVPYPERGYLNLYTFPRNEPAGRITSLKSIGQPTDYYERVKLPCFYEAEQKGKGGLALVFSREAVLALLCQPHMVIKPLDSTRGWRALDGAVSEAMRQAGWKEYVHSPSLTQHVGIISAMGNHGHKQAETFPGEQFNAMEFVK